MSAEKKKRLGEILLQHNLLLPEQLDAALAHQKKQGRRLGQVLIEMGLLSYESLSSVLSDQTGIPHIWLRKGLVDPKVVPLVPRESAEAACVMPMFKVRNTLTLAMVDCDAIFVIDDVETLTGCKVQPVQCRREDIEKTICESYGVTVDMEDFLEKIDEGGTIEVLEGNFEDLRMVEDKAEGARIVNLINMSLINAIREGASDIHIESDEEFSRVRYRIDGSLQETMTVRVDLHAALISRLKVMSRMDIAERRVPQDGRIQIRAEGREVDVRVSSMPTVKGEKMVLRLLDKGKMELDVNKVGFDEAMLADFKALLKRPNGIILVTGPTGSGKTTTLYSGLAYINTISKNIVTIEDPVEYQLPLINQVQVNVDQGLTFAKTLRAILRQDPDIIMVGEIRDRETAEVAIQAALTGHLVLSTLHTNDSAGAVARMMEMKVEPYLLSSALIGVLAQRLVRRVCEDCKTPFIPPRDFLMKLGWKKTNTTFVTGRGCDKCYDTGLRGRTGIFELLAVNERIRKTILQDPSADAIRAVAVELGMCTLKDEAFRIVEENITSLEEILDVVVVDDQDTADLLG